jgi:uncharacterized protein (DUF1015 family)
MVNIRPFSGYRYNEKKLDISRVVLPPYELANEEFKEKFFNMSPFNVIKIYLGKAGSKSNGERYQYSSEMFGTWIRDGYLIRDEGPCLYVYSQEFELEGKKMERTGFVSLVELEELGKNVFPHEETLQDTMINRRLLIEKTRTNFGLIFSLYSDPEKRIEMLLKKAKQNPPVSEFFTDYEGVRHRLWLVRDRAIINKITSEMKNKKLLIADGHHRYKICLDYSKDNPGDEKAKYTSMMLVNIHNDGLAILPTHRLVKDIRNFDKEKLIERMKLYFVMEVFNFGTKDENGRIRELMQRLRAKDGKHFGMYLGDEKYYILGLKDERAMDKEAKEFSKQWRRFDMNILHVLILKKTLGVDTMNTCDQCHMEYVKDFRDNAKKCLIKVRSGECQIALFVNPAKVKQVKEISENGEMIPPKSTCFYPKVYCGVVIHRFDDAWS